MAGPLNFFRIMQHSQFPPSTVPCNAGNINFTGSVGIFVAEAIVLGSGIGPITASFNSFFFPDRFQLIYKGAVVADSLFVGDDFISSATAYNNEVNTIIGTHTQDVFNYDFSQNIFTNTSTTETNTWGTESIATFSDGTSNLRSTGSIGAQVGVIPNLPSATSKNADGNVSLGFFKSGASPSTFSIKVYSHPTDTGTAWEMTSLTCPT